MRALLRILAVVLLVLLLVPYAVTPLYSVARPVSTLMLWRSMRGERVERIWRPIESLSPALPLAVLIAEDARFCQHAGVDWQGLQAAIEDAEDGDIRGASLACGGRSAAPRASCRCTRRRCSPRSCRTPSAAAPRARGRYCCGSPRSTRRARCARPRSTAACERADDRRIPTATRDGVGCDPADEGEDARPLRVVRRAVDYP
jgi:hypothetical protein